MLTFLPSSNRTKLIPKAPAVLAFYFKAPILCKTHFTNIFLKNNPVAPAYAEIRHLLLPAPPFRKCVVNHTDLADDTQVLVPPSQMVEGPTKRQCFCSEL